MKPRRRWFTFSLRTFLVLLTVLGVWLAVTVKWVNDRQHARIWISKHGRFPSHSTFGIPAPIPPAPWSLRLFGEVGVWGIEATVPSDQPYSESELKSLFPEAWVSLDTIEESARH